MLDCGPCHLCGLYTPRCGLVCWAKGEPLPEGEDGLEWLCERCDRALSGHVEVVPAFGEDAGPADVPY